MSEGYRQELEDLIASVERRRHDFNAWRIGKSGLPKAAHLCREKGWGPGTRLAGDEGYGAYVVEVTAVGEDRILAKKIGPDGSPLPGSEESWVVGAASWRVADDM